MRTGAGARARAAGATGARSGQRPGWLGAVAVGAGPALWRCRLARQSAVPHVAAGLPGLARRTRRLGAALGDGRAQQAPRAVLHRAGDRCAGPDQYPAGQPRGAEKDGGVVRDEPGQRAGQPGRRYPGQRRHAGPGGQGSLQRRPEPGDDAGRGGVPQRTAGADPVRAVHGPRACAAAADRAAAGQQVLCVRPGQRQEHGGVPAGAGAAGIHRQLAQSHRGAVRLEPGYLCQRADRGDRGDPRHHRQCRRQPARRLLRRDDHGGADGLLRRQRRKAGACRDADGIGVRTRRGLAARPVQHTRVRHGSAAGQPGARRARRCGAGADVRLAAAERLGVELLGQQLPARQCAAGLRCALLEQRHHAAAGRPARPVSRHADDEPARHAAHAACAGPRHHAVGSDLRQVCAGRHDRPHHAMEGGLPVDARLWRAHRVRAEFQRPRAEPGQSPRQPEGQVLPRRRAGRRAAGLARRRDRRAGLVVATLEPMAEGALRTKAPRARRSRQRAVRTLWRGARTLCDRSVMRRSMGAGPWRGGQPHF
ncbi:hypothetical protein CBM2626_B140078 [Cupriavidus taiwanensis]|nr:hypothetical protein CBM2626_B140078 [Cupriavidus taiwanensis]